jgi:hypothetical protein
MQSILSGGADFLLPGLSYDLSGDQASYCVGRRQSQINSNVPTAGPNDVRQVTFNIADPSGFLDLSSLCFQWTVTNTHATNAMQPLSAVPHCCWSRMIISISSAIAEDIQYLSRTEEMLNRFLPYEKRRAAAAMGFGLASSSENGADHVARTVAAANGEQRVVWRPLSSGILNSGKLFPGMLLGASGLKITLEVPAASEIARDHANDSQTFSFKDLVCHVDSLQLEESISSQYANMLLSGRSIMIPYQTWDNTLQHLTVTSGSQTCNVTKNFTRLDSVFASLAQEEPAVTADLAGIQGKLQNNFYLCDQTAANGDVESYITINNKRMPDFNTIGTQMHMKRLLSAMGTYSSVAHGSNINDAAYGCVKGTVAKSWIAAYDLEKAAHHGASSSGESLATGGILSVNLLKVGSAAASPSRAYINCLYDSVCELKDSGAFIYS